MGRVGLRTTSPPFRCEHRFPLVAVGSLLKTMKTRETVTTFDLMLVIKTIRASNITPISDRLIES